MIAVGLDTETHLAQAGLVAPPIVCGSVSNSKGCHLLDRAQFLRWLRKTLLEPATHLVGCNIVYDLVCAAAADPSLLPLIFDALEADRVHDIAIREALMDIARGDLAERGEDGIGERYGMRILFERYLSKKYPAIDMRSEKKGPDSWRKRYAELEGTPIESWPWKARVYPLRDVAFPLEIFHLQQGKPNLHDEGHQVRAAMALQLMSVWGMRSNAKAVAALRARVEEVDRLSTIEFQKSGIIRANGTENRARLAELVTKAYGGSPPRTPASTKFPDGQVSSDRDTLAESGDPLLERYATAGKNDKFLTTYLPILEQGIRVPWNPEFNVLVATTRVSSDAQQFPQAGGVRECWEARPGHVHCSTDYPGVELRTMSQRAIKDVGYSKMAEVMNSGEDPHLIAAASFMGVTYAEALARYKGKDPAVAALVKVFRDLAKIWNFGKGGGMGPAAMVYNARKPKNGETTTAPDGTVYQGARFCLLTKRAKHCGEQKTSVRVQRKMRQICTACLTVAKQLDEGWLSAWPEQRALFERASRLAKAKEPLSVTIPVSGVVRGKVGYTQWLNTPFQGLAAAAMKRALWIVCREMYDARWASVLFGSRLLLQVHDELISELLEHVASCEACQRGEHYHAGACGDRIAKIMGDTLRQYVPDLAAACEVEPALSRTMTKKAQTVRDSRGWLQVWEPPVQSRAA